METLYQKTRIISRVKKYFQPYLELLTKPSGNKLFLLLLAVFSMQAVTSIAHIYNWFLHGLSKVSLNAYYYLLTYVSLPIDKFAAVTVRKALSLIDEKHLKHPVLLLIDDTLQAKFGTKFECYVRYSTTPSITVRHTNKKNFDEIFLLGIASWRWQYACR